VLSIPQGISRLMDMLAEREVCLPALFCMVSSLASVQVPAVVEKHMSHFRLLVYLITSWSKRLLYLRGGSGMFQ